MKVFEKFKEAVTKEELMLSLSERGKARQSPMIAACSYLEERPKDNT